MFSILTAATLLTTGFAEQTLVCPSGWEQRGALGADIGGCGLHSCETRYDTTTINHCSGRCDDTEGCKSFNYAPRGGDQNHASQTVCTLYDADQPTSTWAGSDGSHSQIFCARTMTHLPSSLPPTCDDNPCPQCDTCATPTCEQPTVVISDCAAHSGEGRTDELTRYNLGFIADIPVGAKNVSFTMTSNVDLDMNLRLASQNHNDPESGCLAGFSCVIACGVNGNGCQQELHGMNIFFSGDDTSNPVSETIKIEYVTEPLVLYVRGWSTGIADVTYEWAGVDPCSATISNAAHYHCSCPAGHYFVDAVGCMLLDFDVVSTEQRSSMNVVASTAAPVNRFTHQSVGVWSADQAPQGDRLDVFDTYDEDLNGNLTLSDLTLMTQHMHIWDEIVNGSSTLTHPEVEQHIQTYNQLWDGIINVIEALDRTSDGVVDDHDIAMINSELTLAIEKMNEWERGFHAAASTLDQSHTNATHTEVSITFDDLEERARNSKQEFKDRIEAAFKRLGGNQNDHVTQAELQHNRERIALLLAAFHDLHENGLNHISKDTYENMLVQIENDVNSLEDQIAAARSRIANGRRLYSEATTYEAEL